MRMLLFYKRQCSKVGQGGGSFIEVAITLPIFIVLICFVIDITRMTWIKSSVRSAMTLAIKDASSNPDLKKDLRGVASTTAPDYQLAEGARHDVVNQALNYKLSSLHQNGGIVFNKYSNVDKLATGNAVSNSVNPGFVLLRPGDAAVSVDADNQKSVVNNSHICSPAVTGANGDVSFLGAGVNTVCPSGETFPPSKSIDEMMFKFPTEMLSEYSVNTILFGRIKQKVVVGTYNHDIELARQITPTPPAVSYYPSPTPTPPPTPTPWVVIEPTTTPTPPPTFTPPPTITPEATSTPTSEPTIYYSPTPDPTETPEPTSTATPTPTKTPSRTPTPTPTETPTPVYSPTITPTPTPNVCEDKMVYKVELKDIDRRNFDPLEKVIAGDYPACIQTILDTYKITRSSRLTRQDDNDEYFVNALHRQLNLTGEWVKQGSNSYATAYMDENCNRIPDPGYHCLTFTAKMVQSPLSLIWETGLDIKTVVSITQFPLNPETPGKWYDWRGSAKTPLLVYDSEHTGLIDSAKQLFGNHTFGERWQNGYKALAKLDANNDQMLTKDELKDLALWFDENQDGISNPGEVKSLAAMEVSVIYTSPSSVDDETGDVHAKVGYVRSINGKKHVMPSVDWFSKAYDSKMQAIADKGVKLSGGNTEKSSTEKQQPPVETGTEKSKFAGIGGIWKWQVEGESPFNGKAPQGFLAFQDKGEAFSGYSLVEVPMHANSINARSAIASSLISGLKKLNGAEKTTLSFRTTDSNGTETSTDAVVSDDGLSIMGESAIDLNGNKLLYTWVAQKVKH